MILLSSIIKAEYVILDNKSNKQVNQIKKPDPQPKVISTPREDLYEMYNQREVILTEAREEAVKILSSARRNAQVEIADLKKKGFEDGYNAGKEIGKNKGYQEGYENGKLDVLNKLTEQNNKVLNELALMLEKVEEQKEEIIIRYEEKLTNLAVEIAEKIIKQKIDSKNNVVAGIIKNVIKDYRNVEWIKVYISNKDDVISIQADKELINELNLISKDVKFEVTDKLDQGSAIVETPDSILDASINTQLNNLKEMVLNKNAVWR